MDHARYLVDAVICEGRSLRTVARAHGVSKSWVAVLVWRYRVGGYDAIAPKSKRPHTSPQRITPEIENAIITPRKELLDTGLDAGPTTIAWHLQRQGFTPPSASTIWRTLTRRGFITPQPKKRPHTSYIRFEAALPNECWQADTTHWTLADGTDVEILDIIDDHPRMIITARAYRTVTGPDVLTVFRQACNTYGLPASVLTDNGAIFNARHRHGRSAFEQELATNNIIYKHSRPYHPQTCGKIERFHQTLKKALDQHTASKNSNNNSTKQSPATTNTDPTGHAKTKHHTKPSTNATTPNPEQLSPHQTSESVPTKSTAQDASHCATAHCSATSSSAANTKAQKYVSTSPTATCASSPSQANYSDTSPSTQQSATKDSTEKTTTLPRVHTVHDDLRHHNRGRGGT